jgi:ferric-dicitrate binding protein FerR (iron transport regulator)
MVLLQVILMPVLTTVIMRKKRRRLSKELKEDHLFDEEVMKQLEAEMLSNIHQQIFSDPKTKVRHIKTFSVAAILLLATAVTLICYHSLKQDKVNWLTVSATKGTMKVIELSDGSRVWLNSGSSLKYPEHFGKTRNIELLNGEAFFDVKHDDHSAFIVQYGDLHTQVLGTAFNIQYYEKINDIRVTVARGKVEVGNKRESFALLTADKEIVYHPVTHTRLIRTVDSRKVSDWMNKQVNLYNVPFDELILKIENIYNVKVVYDSARLTGATTIHFSTDDSLGNVMEMIKTIHSVKYTIKGKEVWINK